MRRNFVKRPVKANTNTRSSRVVAIQLDVEIPEGVSSEDVIQAIEDMAGNSTVQDFHIAGADFVGDLTDIYERDYPDLLVYRD